MDVDSPLMTEPESNQETPQEPSSCETTSTPAAVSPPPQPPSQAVVGGPRPALNYSTVNAIMENKEDVPSCWCVHTLTAVLAAGEGSPGYIGPRLILFSGATALEVNSTPPSPTGSAGIRMECTRGYPITVRVTKSSCPESKSCS